MVIVSASGTREISGQNPDQILKALNEVFKSLYDQFEIVQEVHIDGVPYYNNYNEYILEHIGSIQNITIQSVPEAELMSEIMSELKSYIPKLLQAFDSISELLYGEMTEEEWGFVAQLTEGMQWASQSLHALRNHFERTLSYPRLLESIINFESESEKLAAEMDQFMDNNDLTAVGDQLKYEWSEVFKLLFEQLEAEVFA